MATQPYPEQLPEIVPPTPDLDVPDSPDAPISPNAPDPHPDSPPVIPGTPVD